MNITATSPAATMLAVRRLLGGRGPVIGGDDASHVPGISDPEHYARRVRWLAAVHVALSQRSNVETLTIAFLGLFLECAGLASMGPTAGR